MQTEVDLAAVDIDVNEMTIINHPKVKRIYFFNKNYVVFNSKGIRVYTSLDKDGYRTLSLQGIDGKRVRVKLHQLVAYTFIGFPPKNMEYPTVDHIDGNKTNNNPENLRWLERNENSSSRKNVAFGEKNGSSILKESEVSEICKMLSKGHKLDDIAKVFSVQKTTISNIKRRKTWKYISRKYDFTTKHQKNKEESKKQREEILNLYDFGFSRAEIIKKGYPSSVVYRICPKNSEKE